VVCLSYVEKWNETWNEKHRGTKTGVTEDTAAFETLGSPLGRWHLGSAFAKARACTGLILEARRYAESR